ncbi:hypothetical protein XELAEV_18037698mg [Xenopus laevis]|uniref:Uncharacterized protein n=1 Tax=Xenopus laevis TaxID=8355 RepID=A0A974HAE7_XENLA|nr:hypothetical protein XELAEV_18037698mg [Xenopus laevis]
MLEPLVLLRAYDYMCMGFVLLTFTDTYRYWQSIYFSLQVLVMSLLLLGRVLALKSPRKPRNTKEEKAEAKQENRLQE